ncbi:hypothetical protein ACOMHN_034334 [Nucella lapillus]
MRAGWSAVPAARWTLLTVCLSLVAQVRTTGVFELHLQSFRNAKGLNQDGNCCNGYRTEGKCSSPCKTFFRVCLTHYQVNIATDPSPQCTFGEFSTPVVADNSVNFSSRTDLPMDNPLRFPVREFAWPGDFSLVVEAWHDSTLTGPSQGSPREMISRLAVQRSAAAGLDWYNSKHITRYTELIYSYRFRCDDHYYGAACEDLCRRRDDQFGHYYCSDNGTKVCLDGWQGEYCDRAICLPGCHPDNGFCDEPNECRCRLGWDGKHCNVCIPYPGCQHGSCTTKPYWECNCDEGWGGLFCNQDLNFCTHHTPCKNGGTCTNTGRGSYTCACRPGYNGTNCEVVVDFCQALPCLHGGTCQSGEQGYTCSCPQGFFGENCEQEADYCRPQTCFNGGTCVDHEGSYQCLCAQGYAGFHCEVDTGGCKKDTCKNGGHCVSGECICPSGFSGPACEDDGRDYCLHQPCLNGGVCVDRANDFVCHCVAGFVGNTCGINVDDCEMSPCANGGHCTDMVNDFLCACRPGWTGKDCSVNVDNCFHRPCQHGGVCHDRINDYECQCPEGFWGKDCHLYEGMSTTPLPFPTTQSEEEVSDATRTGSGGEGGGGGGGGGLPPSSMTTTEEDYRQINASRQDGDEDEGLTTPQLLVVVCLGAGIPILLIIVIMVVLLCRKPRHLAHDDMKEERHQNYINNMNNRGDRGSKMVQHGSRGRRRRRGERGDGKMESSSSSSSAIFTTTPSYLPPAHAAASSVKMSNEERQDINRLNAAQHQAARNKNASKNFIRDSLMHEPASVVAAASYPSSSPSPAPTPSLLSHRDSRVYDYEKPIRRLDVDSLSEDTKVDISTYHRHSGDISIIVKPNLDLVPERDNVRRSVYLEPAHPPPRPHTATAHYSTEDYLATEV